MQCWYVKSQHCASLQPSFECLSELQIMLAVLARGYEWEVRQDEPVKTFPMPIPAWGLPMAFHKLKRPVMAREE